MMRTGIQRSLIRIPQAVEFLAICTRFTTGLEAIISCVKSVPLPIGAFMRLSRHRKTDEERYDDRYRGARDKSTEHHLRFISTIARRLIADYRLQIRIS